MGSKEVVFDLLGSWIVVACLSYPYIVVLVGSARVAFDGKIHEINEE